MKESMRKILEACGQLTLLLMLTHIIFGFSVSNSKLRAERSILHINLCLAIAAGIALFLGGLKLTKIRVREITKEKNCIFYLPIDRRTVVFFANASDAVNTRTKGLARARVTREDDAYGGSRLPNREKTAVLQSNLPRTFNL